MVLLNFRYSLTGSKNTKTQKETKEKNNKQTNKNKPKSCSIMSIRV
jgi:hypothetical protein